MAEGVTAGQRSGLPGRAPATRQPERRSSAQRNPSSDHRRQWFELPDAHVRLGPWPYEPDVVQLVLLDHHMTPTPSMIRRWIAQSLNDQPDLAAIRTGAMFPAAAAAFAEVGFRTIDTLALLETHLGASTYPTHTRPGPLTARIGRRRSEHVMTRRMRAHHLPSVAALDRLAFGDPWGNDVRSLDHITAATPRHRARIVAATGPDGVSRVSGFAMTGYAGSVGYLQRLAVDPATRRCGVARGLVEDSLHWMYRRGATTAMVNTGVDNFAALALYQSAGFRVRDETLKILELSADDLARLASLANPSDSPRPPAST